MKPLVLPCRGTRIKLLKKWQLANCSVGIGNSGDRLPLDQSPVEEAGDPIINSLAVGDSVSTIDEVEMGELAALLLLLLPLSDLASTDPLRLPIFFDLRSAVLDSFRKTSSKSSL